MSSTLKIALEARLAERVKKAAADAGVSVSELLGRSLEAWLDSWDEDLRRLEEPGESIDAEVAFAEFESHIRELLDRKA